MSSATLLIGVEDPFDVIRDEDVVLLDVDLSVAFLLPRKEGSESRLRMLPRRLSTDHPCNIG